VLVPQTPHWQGRASLGGWYVVLVSVIPYVTDVNLCHAVYISCAVLYVTYVMTYTYVGVGVIFVSARDPLLSGEW
jgi:hypothetical protein